MNPLEAAEEIAQPPSEQKSTPGPARRSDPAEAKRMGRRKINIEYIEDKNRRHITFSKRKSGIMKKVCLSDLM